MFYKKLFTFAAAALSLIAAVMFIVRVWGTPIDEVIVGLVAYALYGVLMLSYLLRFALIFLGVFGLFRLIQERYSKKMAV